MPVSVWDMLRNQSHKFSRRRAGFENSPGACVFDLIDNLQLRNLEDAPLRDGEPPDVTPCISEKVAFRHHLSDMDVPPSPGLGADDVLKLTGEITAIQQVPAMRFFEIGSDGNPPDRHDLVMVIFDRFNPA